MDSLYDQNTEYYSDRLNISAAEVDALRTHCDKINLDINSLLSSIVPVMADAAKAFRDFGEAMQPSATMGDLANAEKDGTPYKIHQANRWANTYSHKRGR